MGEVLMRKLEEVERMLLMVYHTKSGADEGPG